MNKQPLNAYINKTTKSKIKALAKSNGLTISQVVEQAITNYLNTKPRINNEPKERLHVTLPYNQIKLLTDTIGTDKNNLSDFLEIALNRIINAKDKRLTNKNQLTLHDIQPNASKGTSKGTSNEK